MTFWLLMCSLACVVTPPPGDEGRVAEAICTAFEANRANLAYGAIRFTYTVGKSSSTAAARCGEISEKYVADGTYVYNGDQARYELVFSAEDMASERVDLGGGRSTSQLTSFRLLTNGKVTLFDFMDPLSLAKRGPSSSSGRPLSSFSHSSQIDPGTEVFMRHVLLPIGLGRPDFKDPLNEHVEAAARHQGGWRLSSIDDAAQFEGEDVALLKFEPAEAGARVEYRVDLAHGAISRSFQTFSKSSGPEFEEFYDDLRRVGNKGWVPFRYTIRFGWGLTKQLVITETDFDHPPDQSAFRLEFPEAIPMINTDGFLRYDPQKVWSLDRLPSPSAPGTRRIPPGSAAPHSLPPVLPGVREPLPPWALPSLVFGVALLLLAATTYWRRRRER